MKMEICFENTNNFFSKNACFKTKLELDAFNLKAVIPNFTAPSFFLHRKLVIENVSARACEYKYII